MDELDYSKDIEIYLKDLKKLDKINKYPNIFELESFAKSNNAQDIYNVAQWYYELDEIPSTIQKAFKWFYRASLLGNIESRYRLGILYQTGLGVRLNYKMAFIYLKQAADLNHFEAANLVGQLYQLGKGTKKDIKKAIYYYELAGNNGSSNACYNLALLYSLEHNIPNSEIKEFEWNLKAAELGDTSCMNLIAEDYHEGKIVPKDITLAYQWLYRSAQGGNPVAQLNLAKVLLNEDSIKNKDNAIELLKKSITSGYSPAITELGKYYLDHLEDEENRAIAFYYFQYAQQREELEGIFCLGICYEVGIGCNIDYQKAIECYQSISQGADGRPLYKLGTFFELGIGVEKDYQKAFDYYTEASISRENPIFLGLAKCHLLGIGTPINQQTYISTILTGVLHNEVGCLFEYGLNYYTGSILEQDYTLAFKYFKKCVDYGYTEANSYLANMYLKGLGVEQDEDKGYQLLDKVNNN
jgi:TPR repeat protein